MNKNPNTHIVFQDWGKVPYADAWERQENLLKEIVAIKVANRAEDTAQRTPNYLVFCEHPPVFTLGKSGDSANLLISEQELKEQGIDFFRINRGGDITYHGPGQLVGYPILDLENFYTDIGRYLRAIEEAIILLLDSYGIHGERYPGYTGVWIAPNTPHARKICAIGVRTSRWVTMHGFALNVFTELSYFQKIIPCGIKDKQVTSLASELNQPIDIFELKARLKANFAKLFGPISEQNPHNNVKTNHDQNQF
ncbi:MAG: lipoyl(octanoyl) transferase LipB [Bacteroidia bacterium]|nr:lipoyl(octanoyl) transferase LipB [Bacteroidia bacterium]